jgi:hypothetical protein
MLLVTRPSPLEHGTWHGVKYGKWRKVRDIHEAFVIIQQYP